MFEQLDPWQSLTEEQYAKLVDTARTAFPQLNHPTAMSGMEIQAGTKIEGGNPNGTLYHLGLPGELDPGGKFIPKVGIHHDGTPNSLLPPVLDMTDWTQAVLKDDRLSRFTDDPLATAWELVANLYQDSSFLDYLNTHLRAVLGWQETQANLRHYMVASWNHPSNVLALWPAITYHADTIARHPALIMGPASGEHCRTLVSALTQNLGEQLPPLHAIDVFRAPLDDVLARYSQVTVHQCDWAGMDPHFGEIRFGSVFAHFPLSTLVAPVNGKLKPITVPDFPNHTLALQTTQRVLDQMWQVLVPGGIAVWTCGFPAGNPNRWGNVAQAIAAMEQAGFTNVSDVPIVDYLSTQGPKSQETYKLGVNFMLAGQRPARRALKPIFN